MSSYQSDNKRQLNHQLYRNKPNHLTALNDLAGVAMEK